MKCDWDVTVNRVVELVITAYTYRESSPIGGDRTEIPIPARAQRGIGDASECREWNFQHVQMQMFDVRCSMIIFSYPDM